MEGKEGKRRYVHGRFADVKTRRRFLPEGLLIQTLACLEENAPSNNGRESTTTTLNFFPFPLSHAFNNVCSTTELRA